MLRIIRTMSSQAQIIGPIQATITEKLTAEFQPTSLEIYNDSHNHAHHAGLRGATNVTESHFRIEIVSDKFEGLKLPNRHRLIYNLLDEEIKEKGVHALQMKIKTPSESNKSNK
ncbi:hypothetical protein WICMUC_005611 [Wickerhamomyces mucosus]|uniref:BolA-like protein n=1 Tax=Wickerhamomyces mucosus TaxID=1378264 RepID=A0A9P8P882_9ASCO|nr:hypothetical protein WICMUC_005611 [Wickerhamomyces mucosus]